MVGVTETNRYIHLVQDMQDVMGTWRRVQEPKCVIRKGVLEEVALELSLVRSNSFRWVEIRLGVLHAQRTV